MSAQQQRALRDRLWRDVALTREAIHAAGIAGYVGSLSNLSDAFRLSDRALRCIDGRTPGGVHLAGSGILLGMAEARDFAEGAKLDRVTWHAECGAARLWAGENGVPPEQADESGRYFAERLAAALGVRCEEAPLSGTPGFHDELLVYYDGTGCFDCSRVSGLPRGFVVSRRYHGPQPATALHEVSLVMGISLSDHGFDGLFTPSGPLRLVPIGDPRDQQFALDALTAELRTLALPADGSVVIDGFVAPL